MSGIDEVFTQLDCRRLADAALDRARKQGVTYADFRFERILTQSLRVRDTHLEAMVTGEDVGFAVRVVSDGAWGFAAAEDLSAESAADTASRAVEVARTLAVLNSEPVELAPEPVHTGEFSSAYEIDPFDVPDTDKVAFCVSLNEKILSSGIVDHVDFGVQQVKENKFLASLDGSDLTQQRVRVQGNANAVKVDPDSGNFETMRTICPPRGAGWEHLTRDHDFSADAEQLPELLAEKMGAPSVEPGTYDLVIDPSNLWLVIHESIGHATELDRALGYEANYAGTSFATLDMLDTLQYGSEVMNVTGDRDATGGLATVGWDDEGVEGQRWDIIRDGVLVGYQLNRQMAQRQGFGRSNGCAFADSHSHVPLQRMPNVSLQPSPNGTSHEDLIGGVDRGIYVVGDKSWSIDMQRYNFQFTGQRFYEIRGGRLAGQLRDVAYQSSTIDFWNAMEAVGGRDTYVLGGAFNCGKGQPGQVAPVSHGCPPALFRGIRVLNTASERGEG